MQNEQVDEWESKNTGLAQKQKTDFKNGIAMNIPTLTRK